MKHLRLTTRLEPSVIPPFYAVVAESSSISELRVIDWNVAADEVGTLLYAIDGDAEKFREAADETNGITRISLSAQDQPTSYALVEASPRAIPFFSTFMAVTARAGLVVRKPLVYRDARSFGNVVGEPTALQEAIEQTPPEVHVTVEQIGPFPSTVEDPSRGLTDRQREVIEVARENGYYDQPRGTTHAEIAAELDCAPNTVTTHLQKAEAKLVHAVLRRE
ncbi:putative DNA binding protein [Halogeometricum borinquense DSM 11551]|uniref:Predicted DNA binding protein n=2 Tax=Halogeometricum borinquense TaxID=60847 RepID=E4NU49_HALBP|nr:helix-turn-helix domain-containing protein [Halogeometricum borinquense]ADQ68569.1 predicted DNA binding protein [Halogeometricum borinquense DSM 11551]ELY25560.1 putative DNA binding protein [Halogeometricum borinquense DSM 11551]RYJ08558.1 bacterio-opsin activator [Halogeometricum borinquense]